MFRVVWLQLYYSSPHFFICYLNLSDLSLKVLISFSSFSMFHPGIGKRAVDINVSVKTAIALALSKATSFQQALKYYRHSGIATSIDSAFTCNQSITHSAILHPSSVTAFPYTATLTSFLPHCDFKLIPTTFSWRSIWVVSYSNI